MNIPTDKPIVENIFLENLKVSKLIVDLGSKKFTGYSYLVINTEIGFQESIFIFLKGEILGSIYFNSFHGVEIYGEKAFPLIINSFGYTDGLLNIYELTDDQIKLLLIFNDKIKYTFKINKISVSKLNFKYDPKLFESIFKDLEITKPESKLEVFKRLNLSELMRL